MSLFDLTGRVALVTGSSRGIGKAIAEGFAAHGARVVISSRHLDACEATAELINERYSEGTATAIAASISSKEGLAKLINHSKAAVGGIDVLVCNAASNPHFGPLDSISDHQFRKAMDNNVLSNHWLIQLVLPDMIARRSGSVIITSSIGALRASKSLGAYCITKAAADHLMRSYAIENAPFGVRFNAIAPGFIRTQFARALFEVPEKERLVVEATPIGRIGEPDDVAGAAVFLASAASRFITGQVIVVDGGLTLQSGPPATV